MPIRPVQYTPQPYVRETRTLGQLLGLQAATSGQMWSDLGATLAGGLRQYAQERQQAPMRAQEAEIRRLQLEGAQAESTARQQTSAQEQELTAFMSSPDFASIPDDEKLRGLTRIAGPQKGPKLFQDWFASQQAPVNAATAAADRARKIETEDRDYRRNLNKDGVAEMNMLADNARADAAAKKVTFGAPVPVMVGGKRGFIRPGSDGKNYDMGGKEVDGSRIAQIPEKSAAGPQQPWQWVTRGGNPVYTNQVQPGDVRDNARERAVTGAERKTLGFFNRMLEAERNARAVEGKVNATDFAAEWMPGEMLENLLKTPEGQAYTQAQRTFTEGRLRKESGAAIPQGEYDTDKQTNFKRPNDTPENVKQKRASRLALLRSAANEAGRALEEFYGEGTTLDSLLSEFADTVRMRAPDGRELAVPPEKVDEMKKAGAVAF